MKLRKWLKAVKEPDESELENHRLSDWKTERYEKVGNLEKK